MNDAEKFIQKLLESTAYHEAAHEVTSIVLQIPIQEMGVHIDSKGSGVSLTYRRWAGNPKKEPKDIHEREQSIVLLTAGYIGQVRFCEDASTDRAADDQKHIADLLNEMYEPDSDEWIDAKSKLRDEAKRIVNDQWHAIEALAKALWAKPWASRVTLPEKDMGWSNDTREKWMDAKQVESVLKPFGLCPIIRPNTAGDYEHPAEEGK
jgi:hypothetical protein